MAVASCEIDGSFNTLVTTILKPDVKHDGGFNKKVICGLNENETQSLIAQHGLIDLIGIHINPATGMEYPMDNPTGGNITIMQDYNGTAITGEVILSFRYDLPDEPYKLRIRYTPGKSTITSDVYVSTRAKSVGLTYDGEDKIKIPTTPEYLKQLFKICNKQRHHNCFHEEYYTYSHGEYITLPQSQER